MLPNSFPCVRVLNFKVTNIKKKKKSPTLNFKVNKIRYLTSRLKKKGNDFKVVNRPFQTYGDNNSDGRRQCETVDGPSRNTLQLRIGRAPWHSPSPGPLAFAFSIANIYLPLPSVSRCHMYLDVLRIPTPTREKGKHTKAHVQNQNMVTLPPGRPSQTKSVLSC